jgi:hypothetical protein
MKNLLKAYEILSTVFMFGFLTLMLISMTDNTGGSIVRNSMVKSSIVRVSMDATVFLMLVSFVFIIIVCWTHSSTYANWKTRNNYE